MTKEERAVVIELVDVYLTHAEMRRILVSMEDRCPELLPILVPVRDAVLEARRKLAVLGLPESALA